MLRQVLVDHEMQVYDPQIHGLRTDQEETQEYPFTYHNSRNNLPIKTRIDHVITHGTVFEYIDIFYHQKDSFELVSTHSALTIFIKSSNDLAEIGDAEKLTKSFDSRKLEMANVRIGFRTKLNNLRLSSETTYYEIVDNLRNVGQDLFPLDANNKFEVKSREIFRLRKSRNYYRKMKMWTEYARTVRLILAEERREFHKYFYNKINSLNQKGVVYGKEFYNFVRSYLKEYKFLNCLIENEEGLRNIESTINGIKTYWENLQFHPYFVPTLQDYDGRIYTIILKYYGKQIFKLFTQFVRSHWELRTLITEDELMQFMTDMCENLDYYLEPGLAYQEIFYTELEVIQRYGRPRFIGEEVTKIIDNINKHKAVGIDEIDKHFLVNLNTSYTDKIAELFSAYYYGGYFPPEAKVNIMVNIPKNNNFSYSNCRPICLTPIFNRMYQNLIKSPLFNELDKHMDESQYGFLTKRSCIDACFHFTHRFNKAIAEGYKVLYIWLDISKAFNSLLDFELFEKLVETGLSVELLYAIFNLQCGNRYVIRIGPKQYISAPFYLNVELGQGQVISPREWVFYTKELKEYIAEFNIILRTYVLFGICYLVYADDTGIEIYYKYVSIGAVKQVIIRFIAFLKDKFSYKNLKFNDDKFDVICSDANIDSITISDAVTLIPKRTFKLYGVWFDIRANGKLYYDSNFKLYLEHTIKIIEMCKTLSRANRKIRSHVMSNVCKSYLLGKIDYGCEIINFTNLQYHKLDVRIRIFLKNAYGIRRSTLNYGLYLLSNFYFTKDRHHVRKINYYVKTKYFKHSFYPTHITGQINSNHDYCRIFEKVDNNILNICDITLPRSASMNGLDENNLVDMNLLEQIDGIGNATDASHYHYFCDELKSILNSTLNYDSYLAYQLKYQMRGRLNVQLKEIIQNARSAAEIHKYDIVTIYPNFYITGINWVLYFDVEDQRPRIKLNNLSIYFKAFVKLFTNSYRLGIWLRSHSKYRIDEEVLYASNGSCALCWQEGLETDEHLFRCPFYEDIHQAFAVKLRAHFGQITGWHFIEEHLINNLRHKLVYCPQAYFNQNHCRLDKEQFTKFDLFTKRYCWELRHKRTSKMKSISLQDRFDLVNIEKYTELIIRKLRSFY